MRTLLFATIMVPVVVLTRVVLVAGPDMVGLPDKYQTNFINYLDVDRFDRKRVRKMYVNPEAHVLAQPGADLPDGTILIMEDHDAKTDEDGTLVRNEDGRLIALEPVTAVFVMEKNVAWSTANGKWKYGWYQADGNPKLGAKFDGCFSCHASREDRDFTFTYWKFVSDRAK